MLGGVAAGKSWPKPKPVRTFSKSGPQKLNGCDSQNPENKAATTALRRISGGA